MRSLQLVTDHKLSRKSPVVFISDDSNIPSHLTAKINFKFKFVLCRWFAVYVCNEFVLNWQALTNWSNLTCIVFGLVRIWIINLFSIHDVTLLLNLKLIFVMKAGSVQDIYRFRVVKTLYNCNCIRVMQSSYNINNLHMKISIEVTMCTWFNILTFKIEVRSYRYIQLFLFWKSQNFFIFKCFYFKYVYNTTYVYINSYWSIDHFFFCNI